MCCLYWGMVEEESVHVLSVLGYGQHIVKHTWFKNSTGFVLHVGHVAHLPLTVRSP